MRWFLGSFVKRWWESPGRRPARLGAPPAPSLERLEDRRLLSAATALQPPALLDPNLETPAAIVGAAAPGGSAVAPSPVQISPIAAPTLPDLNWTVAGVYQIQAPTPTPSVAPPSGQTASQNPTPSGGGSGASSAATPTNASGQSTTNSGQDSSAPAPVQGDPAAPSLQIISPWLSDEYYAIQFQDYSLYLRVRASLAPPTPVPAPSGADASVSPSSSAPDGTTGATTAVAPTTTGDAATPASQAPTQATGSTLTVEISYAVQSARPAVGASPAPNAEAVNTVLSVVVTAPAAPGQGIGVSVTVADASAGVVGADSPPVADAPAATESAPDPTAFSFSFQLLIALGQGSATGAPSPSSPSAALSPAGGSADYPPTVPADSPGPAASAAPDAGGSTTNTPATTPALTPVVEVLVIDAPAPTALAAKVAAAAVAAWAAQEWTTAAPTGPVVAAPQVGVERWAALAGSLSEGLVAASVDPLAFFASGAAWAPQGNAASGAPGSGLTGALDEQSGIGAYLCAAGGVVLSGLNLPNGLGSDAAAQNSLPIAEVVRESSESLTALVRGLYWALLGRAAGGGEEQGWVAALLGGQTHEQLLEAFLSTAEFGLRADGLAASGTPDERYLGALHLTLLQRPATAEELTAWLAALPELGRDGVVGCLVRSNEFRALTVQGFYQEVYGQATDPADAAAWAASPLHLLAIREALATRSDLFAVSEPRP